MLGKALQPVTILIDSEKKISVTLGSSAALLKRILLPIHNPSLALFTTLFAIKAYAVYLLSLVCSEGLLVCGDLRQCLYKSSGLF